MVAVTWLAVYPLITLILTVVMVTLMTYVIMPRMTRPFSFWLYPNRD